MERHIRYATDYATRAIANNASSRTEFSSGQEYILAMNSTRCKLCRKSSIRLERKDRKHIIDKHFHLTNVDGISSFYRDISLRMVFETFKAKLRDGILEEGDHHPSRNMIYYCPFAFVVGSSPTRRGRRRTRYVRVACTRSICPNCDHNVIKVKTIFPDGQRKPISH